ncbi:MAG TPA: thiamine phosphate synthase [Ferrovibrio sp.]|uniref:thiamine phosphate synthase n=1 Tax=Ferrovibrio sp. TaxID=1917215 RepID=UPI002ED4091F
MKRQGRTLAIPGRRRKPRAAPRLLAVTDLRRMADPRPMIERLPRGSGVLFRHYELPRAARLQLARQIAALCRQRGLFLLVAGDAPLAQAVGADGLHLPEWMLHGRRRPRGGWLVTAAAHNAAAIARAARGGAAAVLISPVFATASHPGAKALGPVRFAALAAQARRRGLLVYALGGIDAATLKRLRPVPKTGIAAIAGMAALAECRPDRPGIRR